MRLLFYRPDICGPEWNSGRRNGLPGLGLGAIIALFALQGCKQESNDLMPLSDTSHWKYLVRSINSYSNRVQVSGRIAVGDTEGYVLSSNLGVSHLGWSHGVLISDQMAGSRFYPPISVLAPREKLVPWAGWVYWGDKIEPGKAQTVSSVQRLEINGVQVTTTRSIVSLKLPNRIVELTNWFKPGLGLVRQEQRTNHRLDVILEYLDQS